MKRVLLVPGWTPHPKHIQTITAMYQANGYTVDKVVFGFMSSVYIPSYKSIELVKSFRRQGGQPLYDTAHVLSGGYWPFASLVSYHKAVKVTRVVYDSSPVEPTHKFAEIAIRDAGYPFVSNVFAMVLDLHWRNNIDYLENVTRDLNEITSTALIGDKDHISPVASVRKLLPKAHIVTFMGASHLRPLRTNPILYHDAIFGTTSKL